MSAVVVCDGCGRTWPSTVEPMEGPAIVGRRANGMGGGGLPDGEFHWCEPCAEAAFRAVRTKDGDG